MVRRWTLLPQWRLWRHPRHPARLVCRQHPPQRSQRHRRVFQWASRSPSVCPKLKVGAAQRTAYGVQRPSGATATVQPSLVSALASFACYRMECSTVRGADWHRIEHRCTPGEDGKERGEGRSEYARVLRYTIHGVSGPGSTLAAPSRCPLEKTTGAITQHLNGLVMCARTTACYVLHASLPPNHHAQPPFPSRPAPSVTRCTLHAARYLLLHR